MLLKYSCLAGVGLSGKAYLERGPQFSPQGLGKKGKGKDGATVTRDAETGGLHVLGTSEILSQNTKYQKDRELGLVVHIWDSRTQEAKAGSSGVQVWST